MIVMQKVAALFVDPSGPYFGRRDVDPWDVRRDARRYAGPLPVVAHPPCERWGKFYWRGPGNTRGQLGDDQGCFASALRAVEEWGGVLEHPEGSRAWQRFGIPQPLLNTWRRAPRGPRFGWTCMVDQGRYGHRARKRTWLYYVGEVWPIGIDTRPSTRPVLTRPGSTRVGVELMTHRERRLTPTEFCEALLRLARLSREQDQ